MRFHGTKFDPEKENVFRTLIHVVYIIWKELEIVHIFWLISNKVTE